MARHFDVGAGSHTLHFNSRQPMKIKDEETHWDTIAPDYDSEVFDVFMSDKHKTLERYFRKLGDKTKTAIDFGCGIGKAFSYMAPRFKKVLAVDISQECIDVARNNHYHNISYRQVDLTQQRLNLPKADFALCCNVAILPEPEKNQLIIKNISKSLRTGGIGLFVVPALESALYATLMMMEWFRREGVTSDQIPDHELDNLEATKRELVQGLIHIQGVPTKHYLRPELDVVFRNAGLVITKVEKLEYDWRTEFDKPPAWLREPLPWDWMIECRKGLSQPPA